MATLTAAVRDKTVHYGPELLYSTTVWTIHSTAVHDHIYSTTVRTLHFASDGITQSSAVICYHGGSGPTANGGGGTVATVVNGGCATVLSDIISYCK